MLLRERADMGAERSDIDARAVRYGFRNTGNKGPGN